MSNWLPEAPRPVEAPVPVGTRVILDASARFLDRDFLTGGSPWRLLRLPGGSRAVAERWREGDVVQAGEERFARTLVQQGLLHPVVHEMVDLDDVDVVVPVRDDVASLRALLGQLSRLHVTVVDDGSSDPDSIERCAQEFDTQFIRLRVNAGPGAARNAGVFATSRPLLWFIDVDVTLDSPLDTLHRLAGPLGDPLVAATAPRITGAGGTSVRDRFERRFGALDMGPASALVVPGGIVGYVPSACLLVRRAAFGEGFDEALRTGEDVDLVWRLHDRGWLVRYNAEVVVAHRARGDWRQWWDQRVGYGASTSDLAKRHGTRLAPLRADAWTLIAWSSALVGRPMIGARILRVARDQMRVRVAAHAERPGEVANALVARGMLRAGVPLARSVIRTFGAAVLVSALHPRLRRQALLLFVVGTVARGRSVRMRVDEVPVAVADDLAYGVGVAKGAWRSRSLATLRPQITKSSIRAADLLGRRPRLGSTG